jgi:hypothetical protein
MLVEEKILRTIGRLRSRYERRSPEPTVLVTVGKVTLTVGLHDWKAIVLLMTCRAAATSP